MHEMFRYTLADAMVSEPFTLNKYNETSVENERSTVSGSSGLVAP